MGFGTTPISTTTLGANQFPTSAVASPDTPLGNLTSLMGAPGAYQDSNSNNMTAAMMQIAQPRIVQSAHAVTGSGGKTLTCAFTNPNIKGNSIVVEVGLGEVEIGGGSPITLAVTDSNNNGVGSTYTQAIKASQSTTLESAIFYVTYIANGANTITVTIAGAGSSNTGIGVNIYEVYGLIALTPGALDQTGTGSNAGSTAVATSVVSPLLPNEIAFCAIAAAGGTITAGANWTLDSGSLSPTGGNLVSFGSESYPLATLGGVTGLATLSGSNAWAACIATFKSVSVPVEARVQGYGYEIAGQAAANVTSTSTDLIPSFDTSDYTYFVMQLTGTWGMNLQAQWSNDNVTFTAGEVITINWGGGTTFNTNMGANGMWIFPKLGRYLRIRPNTWASNTSCVGTLECYTQAPIPFNQPIQVLNNSIAVTQSGNWTMQPVVGSANGSVPYHNLSAATTNFTNVKGSACQMYRLSISNTSASAIYVKIYDKSTTPATTDTPKATHMINANTFAPNAMPEGMHFANGMGWSATGAVADNDNTAIGANCVIDFSLNS